MRNFVLAALALTLPASLQAHEIWIERDGTAPARIYLGEPAEQQPAGGDPEFAKLKAPRIVTPDGATLSRKIGFIEVTVPAGDVRLRDDSVFVPWGDAGNREGVIYYARAGRTETRTKLPFELAPTTAGGSRFRLLRDGKPVAGQKVSLIAPDRSQQELMTDGKGEVSVPVRASGRYLLVASRKVTGRETLPGGAVDAVHHITTTSFVEG